MRKTINNALIRTFNPCYDPKEKITNEKEYLSIKKWISKYQKTIPAKDILWLLLREEFLSEKDLRLFAVWCARESFKLQKSVNERSINAVNIAEKFANGEASKEELSAAESAAWSAAESAAWSAAELTAWLAARSAAESAAWSAARSAESAARSAAWSAESAAESTQLKKLISYFH